jgi:hypothetical protein
MYCPRREGGERGVRIPHHQLRRREKDGQARRHPLTRRIASKRSPSFSLFREKGKGLSFEKPPE